MLIQRLLSLTFFLLGWLSFGQNSENSKLLTQAEESVFYNPKEAFAIADHVYKNTSNPKELYQSQYLIALSNYILGNYDQSLIFSFSTKSKAQKSNHHNFVELSNALIDRIFNFLMLDVEHFELPNKVVFEVGLQAEDLIKKSNAFLYEDKLDSVQYYLKQTEKLMNFKQEGYAEALYFSAKGDLNFKKQELNSSLNFYLKADSIAQKIQNPFLLIEINQRLATNYLALDQLNLFHSKSQYVNELKTQTVRQETQAANRAHALLVSEMDDELNEIKHQYEWALYVLAILLLIVIVLKLIFDFRNRNKLKMFAQMLSYLNSHQSENNQELIQLSNQAKTEQEKSSNKSSSMLKESELQILEDLRKFELSKKYTSKEMSLAMLASELNVNTKYLSKVINEHKKKNFNAYINELRINFIVDKIKTDPSYLNYKVSYLAEESGFSSHSSFTTVFKSIVGVSPITFIEFVKEESLEKIN